MGASRYGKILAALTDTGAKRFGLSCALVAAVATIAVSIHTEDPYRISRLAQESLLEEHAKTMGLPAYWADKQIRDECAKKSANIEISIACHDTQLFGGFGELLDRRRDLMRIEYYGLSFLAAILVGIFAALVGWAVLAVVAPLCASYWAWLRRG